MQYLDWVQGNYVNVLTLLSLVVAVGEVVTRFTKTKHDDGFVQRVGKVIKGIMDFLKIPNRTIW
jgi:hypothetical protein